MKPFYLLAAMSLAAMLCPGLRANSIEDSNHEPSNQKAHKKTASPNPDSKDALSIKSHRFSHHSQKGFDRLVIEFEGTRSHRSITVKSFPNPKEKFSKIVLKSLLIVGAIPETSINESYVKKSRYLGALSITSEPKGIVVKTQYKGESITLESFWLDKPSRLVIDAFPASSLRAKTQEGVRQSDPDTDEEATVTVEALPTPNHNPETPNESISHEPSGKMAFRKSSPVQDLENSKAKLTKRFVCYPANAAVSALTNRQTLKDGKALTIVETTGEALAIVKGSSSDNVTCYPKAAQLKAKILLYSNEANPSHGENSIFENQASRGENSNFENQASLANKPRQEPASQAAKAPVADISERIEPAIHAPHHPAELNSGDISSKKAAFHEPAGQPPSSSPHPEKTPLNEVSPRLPATGEVSEKPVVEVPPKEVQKGSSSPTASIESLGHKVAPGPGAQSSVASEPLATQKAASVAPTRNAVQDSPVSPSSLDKVIPVPSVERLPTAMPPLLPPPLGMGELPPMPSPFEEPKKKPAPPVFVEKDKKTVEE